MSASFLQRYPLSRIAAQRDELFAQVLACARRDLDACNTTPGKRFHHPLCYARARDDAQRDSVLGAVWPAVPA